MWVSQKKEKKNKDVGCWCRFSIGSIFIFSIRILPSDLTESRDLLPPHLSSSFPPPPCFFPSRPSFPSCFSFNRYFLPETNLASALKTKPQINKNLKPISSSPFYWPFSPPSSFFFFSFSFSLTTPPSPSLPPHLLWLSQRGVLSRGQKGEVAADL